MENAPPFTCHSSPVTGCTPQPGVDRHGRGYCFALRTGLASFADEQTSRLRTFSKFISQLRRTAGRWAFLLTAGRLLAATNAPSGLVIRSWDTEAGLPQNTVNVIKQTRDGYLWLGTKDGLARFDGVRFTPFGLHEGLQSVEVQALHEDRNGTLWIGTGGGGLSRLVDGRIETVPGSLHLAGDNISSLAEDAEENLWIGTRTGLSLCRENQVVTQTNLAPLGRAAINALLRGRAGSMWIATARQGLYEFKNNQLVESLGPAGDEKILAYCLLEDRSGNLWASVGNGKVLCRQDGTWRTYSETNGLPFVYVTSLTEDADGTIWTGTLDDGLYRFAAGRFTAIRKTDGLSANDIRSLSLDREGNLWVGTRTGGLNRIAQRKLIYCGPAQGLTNDFTRSVAETADGTLWVGTIGGGLYFGGLDSFIHVASETPTWWLAFVDSVLAATDGSVWYGGRRGLVRLRAGKVENLFQNETWLRSASVTALCKDLQGGLWIGTSEGRLEHFQNGEFTEFARTSSRGPITALVQQPDGFLWVGSEAGGLKRIRAGSDAVLALTNGLASQSIRTLYRDAEGTLWIGTAGGGLSCWRDGRMTTFTAEQGLAAHTISQIVEDDGGDLWLGSNRGIFRVHKSDLNQLAAGTLAFVHPRVFGVSDGMPIEECSSGFCPAGLKTRAGLICFSTVRGLVFLDPRRQETNAPAPAILLEEVLVNGRPHRVETARSGGSGNENTNGAAGVHIPPGGRDVELHYTGISFAAPEKISFRYRLEGLDKKWVEAGGRRTAPYPNIPAGDFVFHISACNADGVWSEDLPALQISVEPYLWEKAWFRIAAVLAGLAVLGGAARLVERRRYKRRLALLETQHAIERERLRISQDMHDDIGSILTQVSQLSDLGQSDPIAAVATQKQFERIGQQARGAVQSLDEIVWATNPKNDNLPQFVEYVCRFADECFEASTIRCWQEVPTSLPNLPLRTDVRHDVFLAIKEAFTNALKHSRATEIWLRLELRESEVCISVKDNGRGFDPQKVAVGGNGLENMKTRLAECGGRVEFFSAPAQGAEIKFIFPLPKAA
jgi:ligand-binding sensor domain-containing protein/signal transduction histidine kinase